MKLFRKQKDEPVRTAIEMKPLDEEALQQVAGGVGETGNPPGKTDKNHGNTRIFQDPGD